MARPKVEDNREVREYVAEGVELSREQLAECWLRAITGGDIRGYAEKIRQRHDAAMRTKRGAGQAR